jgi:putative phosphoribosyl transferase
VTEVSVATEDSTLVGDLDVPQGARSIVAFAHGSGSGRHSPRNVSVAGVLQRAGLATLLIDLLTEHEDDSDRRTAELRFDIGLLAARVAGATRWLEATAETKALRVGYFGASTGAAAALVAAAQMPDAVGAIVSRGGRPDIAGDALPSVKAPTLLIVGGDDHVVLGMNRDALGRLSTERRLDIVPGASHLFEEPGKLDEVARLARDWFLRYLR